MFNNDINPRNQQALIRAVKMARSPYRITYGPEVTALALQNETIEPGKNLVVNYTIDDTRYSTYRTGVPSQNIDSLKWSIDKPSWIGGSNPKVVSLRKSVPVYSGTFAISSSALNLTPGRHILYVEGFDGQAWGAPTAIFFYVSEGSITPTVVPTLTPQPTETPQPELQNNYLPFVIAKPPTRQK